MKIRIVHDSLKGNGNSLAEKLSSELESRGAEVSVGHRSEMTPEDIASDPPDLLIVGAAVRVFITSPPVKRWIGKLASELNSQDANIPYAAIFLTHVMPDKAVENRVARLQGSLSRIDKIGTVQKEWLSGQVKDIPGPFIDGTDEKIVEFATLIFDWANTN